MDLLNHLALGFGVAFVPVNLLYALIGALLGTFIGVLPGIGPALTGISLGLQSAVRQLERTRNRHDGDGVRGHLRLLERLERPGEHPVRQPAVEAGDDDGDLPLAAARVALDHLVAVGNLDLALDVLDALTFLGRILDHLAGLRLRPRGERVLVDVGNRLVDFDGRFVLGLAHSLSHSASLRSW